MINNYGYKPAPEFGYKNDRESRANLTFGVELEVEPRNDGGNVRMDRYDLSDAIDSVPGGRTYCKSDGSLESGVEIVSHPGTLAHHMYVMHWRQICRTCEKAGFRSHDARNCGLHVHVGRKQLGNTDDERDEVVRKVQTLFSLYSAELTRFSRRTLRRLNEWAPIRTYSGISRSMDPVELQHWADRNLETYSDDHNDRYTAVNVTNGATVEIRIFRGTLKRDTLIAAIQLVSNIFEYAMTHTWADVLASTWADVAAYKPYKEITAYMEARGLLSEDDAPATLPDGNRPPDFFGTDGIARATA